MAACAGLVLASASAVAFGPAPAGAASTVHCAPTGTSGIAGPRSSHVDVFDSLAQLLPTIHQRGASSASICQARNAIESFQIEVTAAKGYPIYRVSLKSSALTGPDKATIPAADVRLAREAYTKITTVTDAELSSVVKRDSKGHCTANCEFPDALIPDVDPLFHQKRKAFPFEVPAGQTRAVWVDVQVPVGQRPGAYTGTITITRAAGALAKVPVHVEVVGATLPSTSSLGGAFFIALGGGRVTSPAMYDEFAELGLDNRITLVPDSAYPISDFTSTFAKLVSGTDSRVLLKGARFTAFPMHALYDPSDGWTASTVAAYLARLNAVHRGSIASLYCDEWTAQKCHDAYTASAADTPGIPATVVANPGYNQWPAPNLGNPAADVPAQLAGVPVKTLIIVVNSVQARGRASLAPDYTAWRTAASGRAVWLYETCESGGCPGGSVTSSAYTGWPSYGIDQYASEQRAMGWQLYRTGATGDFYYEVDSVRDPTPQPYNFGMNGDGTLFYPWNATEVGGSTPIPLESIRLKRIRDGLQDYELLKLLTARSTTDAHEARSVAATLFPAMDESDPSRTTFDADRQKLILLLPH